VSVDVVGKSDFETQPTRVSPRSPNLTLPKLSSHRKEAHSTKFKVVKMIKYSLPQSITLPNSTTSHPHRPKVFNSRDLISKNIFLLNFYHVEKESRFVKPALSLCDVVLCFQEVSQLSECSHALTRWERGFSF